MSKINFGRSEEPLQRDLRSKEGVPPTSHLAWLELSGQGKRREWWLEKMRRPGPSSQRAAEHGPPPEGPGKPEKNFKLGAT